VVRSSNQKAEVTIHRGFLCLVKEINKKTEGAYRAPSVKQNSNMPFGLSETLIKGG